ncbi:SAM-dependent methyltransferase [Dyella flagellata]|uniref:Tetrapyrrole methylase domain-containing protein n=1 Tax=Dyella flagellata TaxID=1867833 RepID=A0ABQ5X5T6_9GAMM|nr:SAM-dependent methyltransferase [Dyella flagellata]GLQ86577.1 hypothetical protein GCM10007898_01430 [Dyella flagellata]
MKKGSLAVVGTGIQAPGQITLETKDYLAKADKVFYLVPDPFASRYIRDINPDAEDLYHFYVPGQPRKVTYENMVDTILAEVRKNKRVCAAFYGHPGVFAYPTHKSVYLARKEGYRAVMLSGVSSEDCMISDLGLDPSIGCHSYEATSFLVRPVPIFPSCMLILWQIGVIGDLCFTPKEAETSPAMEILTERLLQFYPENQEVIVYEASFSPVWGPRADAMPLKDLPRAVVSGISTLVIPPVASESIDQAMIDRLGINREWMGKIPHSSLETRHTAPGATTAAHR